MCYEIVLLNKRLNMIHIKALIFVQAQVSEIHGVINSMDFNSFDVCLKSMLLT